MPAIFNPGLQKKINKVPSVRVICSGFEHYKMAFEGL